MSNTLIDLQVHIDPASTAEWRWEKAAQFPDDVRNEKAAEELERIANEIGLLRGSEIHRQIDEACQLLNNLMDNERVSHWEKITEAVSEKLRSIGFHSSHTGTSLLEWYRDLVRDEALDYLDEIVPAPDLEEQVEVDPAVKAAKEAYERAQAKAYAESRKRL
jgi:2,4-dienoyl-CoA reductase-like NADH-dependent reductase (Old Yellow Enzyme family)